MNFIGRNICTQLVPKAHHSHSGSSSWEVISAEGSSLSACTKLDSKVDESDYSCTKLDSKIDNGDSGVLSCEGLNARGSSLNVSNKNVYRKLDFEVD